MEVFSSPFVKMGRLEKQVNLLLGTHPWKKNLNIYFFITINAIMLLV